MPDLPALKMETPILQLHFSSVELAPELPGIYAWYYRIELSDADIQNCIESCKSSSTASERSSVVETFLVDRVFCFYTEIPYRAYIEGPLKPAFSGDLFHRSAVSTQLVQFFCDCPDALFDLKATLFSSVPIFASPIYIGMSKNLRNRLLTHKRLIENYREQLVSGKEAYPLPVGSPEDSSGHSFARDVVFQRKIHPNFLQIYARPIEAPKSPISCIENILNRINYPLCGRN